MKKTILLLLLVLSVSCNNDDENSCDGAIASTTKAMAAFTNDNSTANCLKFKQALIHQKEVCGSLTAELENELINLSCD